eukprot:TRINITY_DN8328_c0_g1_i1.p1 TRINITY_DN8328_c0_g1~~TRINITY_DN8328_c0_g1_i1.p1  ORF type:complete len:268 (+),score=70.40 TRINITY_DN8328_c0_g1_i1:91-894(+)
MWVLVFMFLGFCLAQEPQEPETKDEGMFCAHSVECFQQNDTLPVCINETCSKCFTDVQCEEFGLPCNEGLCQKDIITKSLENPFVVAILSAGGAGVTLLLVLVVSCWKLISKRDEMRRTKVQYLNDLQLAKISLDTLLKRVVEATKEDSDSLPVGDDFDGYSASTVVPQEYELSDSHYSEVSLEGVSISTNSEEESTEEEVEKESSSLEEELEDIAFNGFENAYPQNWNEENESSTSQSITPSSSSNTFSETESSSSSFDPSSLMSL